MKKNCKKSWLVNLTSDNISWILYTSYIDDPQIFRNLNLVAHLVVPVGWGSFPAEAGYFLSIGITMSIILSQS